MAAGSVYLIPTVLHEGQVETIPHYILKAVQQCTVFFVENERTARRYLKLLWKEMVIDAYEWYNIKETTPDTIAAFKKAIKEHKIIGIISEAGCPGVADPGQQLVRIAQEMKATVKPLVGPSSILLALMASGMNGQQFQFVGYLPIDAGEKIKKIKLLEAESKQKDCTQVFIETPYRNNQLLETLVKTCKSSTHLCIASELTSEQEFIKTKTIQEWKQKQLPDLHKKPVIFLIYSSE